MKRKRTMESSPNTELCELERMPLHVFRLVAGRSHAPEFFRLRRCSKRLFSNCDYLRIRPFKQYPELLVTKDTVIVPKSIPRKSWGWGELKNLPVRLSARTLNISFISRRRFQQQQQQQQQQHQRHQQHQQLRNQQQQQRAQNNANPVPLPVNQLPPFHQVPQWQHLFNQVNQQQPQIQQPIAPPPIAPPRFFFHPLALPQHNQQQQLIHIPDEDLPTKDDWRKMLTRLQNSEITVDVAPIEAMFFQTMSPDLYRELLMQLQVRDLTGSGSKDIPSEFLKALLVPTLRKVDIWGSTDLDDELLNSIKAPLINLEGKGITDNGINQFLKAYLDGTRRVDSFSYTVKDGNFLNADACLFDIQANVLWTPDHHSESLVGKVTIDCLDAPCPLGLYVLWRPGHHTHPLVVNIRYNSIKAFTTSASLDQEVYKLVMEENRYKLGICRYCMLGTVFCACDAYFEQEEDNMDLL